MTRLLFEGTRTVGVEYLHNDTIHQVRVNQEVILKGWGVRFTQAADALRDWERGIPALARHSHRR